MVSLLVQLLRNVRGATDASSVCKDRATKIKDDHDELLFMHTKTKQAMKIKVCCEILPITDIDRGEAEQSMVVATETMAAIQCAPTRPRKKYMKRKKPDTETNTFTNKRVKHDHPLVTDDSCNVDALTIPKKTPKQEKQSKPKKATKVKVPRVKPKKSCITSISSAPKKEKLLQSQEGSSATETCQLMQGMDNTVLPVAEEVFFLAFLDQEQMRYATEVNATRFKLLQELKTLDASNVVGSSHRRQYMNMRHKLRIERDLLFLERDVEKFSRLVERFEKYYAERDMHVKEEEIIEAFKREGNQVGAEMQIVFCRDKDHCPACFQPYVYSADESTLFCSTCSYSTMYIDAKPSAVAYGDQVEFSSFSYKRINHFSEYSNHLQARESKQVPRGVLRQIMEILVTRLHITDYKNVDFLDVRMALKIMGARSYYDHVMQAWSKITGRVPLRLEPAVEELMHLMFAKIQQPWINHRPDERKNFLSYPYVFYKFCQLLGFEDMLKYFPLLKGKEKLMQQENTFKKICGELGWPWVAIENLGDEVDELRNVMSKQLDTSLCL